MPCQVWEPSYSSAQMHNETARGDKYKELADKLTHENDMLREAIILAWSKEPKLFTAKTMKVVNANQVKHRKEDLARLEATFRKSRDAEKLGLVMLADPTKPLEKQLGFDPDAY